MIFCVLCTILSWLPLFTAFIYPALQTVNAWNEEKFDRMRAQWIVYWVIAGVYTYFKSILYLDYIPLLWLVETIVAGWLVHPKTLGALYLHVAFIEKIFNDVIEKQVAPPLKNILSKIPL